MFDWIQEFIEMFGCDWATAQAVFESTYPNGYETKLFDE